MALKDINNELQDITDHGAFRRKLKTFFVRTCVYYIVPVRVFAAGQLGVSDGQSESEYSTTHASTFSTPNSIHCSMKNGSLLFDKYNLT